MFPLLLHRWFFSPKKLPSISTLSGCTSCDAGRYSAQTGQTLESACIACDGGKFSVAGSSSCEFTASTCPAGTQTMVNSRACALCDAGKVTEEDGLLQCTPCVAGKFAAPNRTQCMSCPTGRVNEGEGADSASVCMSCAAGTFANAAQSLCQPCPMGFYNPFPERSAASDPCLPCEAGRFGDQAGQQSDSACKECAAGYYGEEQGQTSCAPCEKGLFGDESLMTACNDCPRGRFTEIVGQSSCPPCPNGFYKEEASDQSCRACLAGTFLNTEGSISREDCLVCLGAKFADAAGSSLCSSCPSGWFLAESDRCGGEDTAADHASCTRCPLGWSSAIESRACTKIAGEVPQRPTLTLINGTSLQVKLDPREARSVDVQWSKDELFRILPSRRDGVHNGTIIHTVSGELLTAAVLYVRVAESGTESWSPPTAKWVVRGDCTDKEYLEDMGGLYDWRCRECPDGAYCVGDVVWGDVKAKFGFWRVPGPAPQQFRRCLLPSACLGAPNPDLINRYFDGDRSEAHDLARESWWEAHGKVELCHEAWGFKEQCAGGGRCRLCSSCREGFKRKGLADCAACPEQGANKALLAGGIVAVLLGGAGIVYMSIRSEGGVVEVSEAIKKIALNYLQVVSLAAVFPMKWPPAVQTFFEAQAAISSASKSLLSPACELSNLPAAIAFYQIQVGFAFLPFVIVLLCVLSWGLLYRCSFHKACVDRLYLSCVVLLYLAYPTLVKQSLAALACESVGDRLWLAADLQEPCFEGMHLGMVLSVSVPQVLLYTLGLPVGAFLLLFRNRRRLGDKRMQFRWGILYAGFRAKVYWWELSVVVRKIAMIVIGGVFGSHLEPDMQVYAALFVVAVMIVAHLVASPYDSLSRHHAVLNWLEFGSLCACWATLYSGMLFFIGDKGRIGEGSLMWLSIGVIAANASFTVFLAVLYARYAIREKRRGGVADMRRRLTKIKQMRHVAMVGRAGREKVPDKASLHVGASSVHKDTLSEREKLAMSDRQNLAMTDREKLALSERQKLALIQHKLARVAKTALAEERHGYPDTEREMWRRISRRALLVKRRQEEAKQKLEAVKLAKQKDQGEPIRRAFTRHSSRALNLDLAREAQAMEQALTNFHHHVHHKNLHTGRIGRRKSQAKDRLKRRLKDRQEIRLDGSLTL